MNIIIIIVFLIVLGVLFQGLYHMLKSPRNGVNDLDNKKKLVRALTWRISISICLVAFIFLSKEMGWIEPSNSMNPSNFQKEVDKREK